MRFALLLLNFHKDSRPRTLTLAPQAVEVGGMVVQNIFVATGLYRIN